MGCAQSSEASTPTTSPWPSLASATLADAAVVSDSTVADAVSLEFHARFLVGSKSSQGSFGHIRGQVRRASLINSKESGAKDCHNAVAPSSGLPTPKTPKGSAALSMLTATKQFSARSLALPNPDTPEDVAVKVIDLKRWDTRMTLVQAEISMWKLAGQHPNCIQLYNAFGVDRPGLCYMVFESCRYSLFKFLEDSHVINERSVGDVFHQMLTGLSHVHGFKVVHGDIRPANFYVGGGEGRCDTIKLADVGLSAQIPATGKLTNKCGSVLFACPEMILGTGYNEKADVWALGVTVYALLYGLFPYKPNEAEPEKGISTPKFIAKSVRSEGAVAFTKDLLSWAPEVRPSAKEALTQYTYMDAIRRENHELPNNVMFPSLRQILYDAKKNGVFQPTPKHEADNATEREYIDGLLNSVQVQLHCKPLPDTERPNVNVTKSLSSKSKGSSKVKKTVSDRSP